MKLLTENHFPIELACSKIICIGRNYIEHAHELSNPIPKSPLLFLKPTSSLINIDKEIALPFHLGEIHHEIELAFLFKESIAMGEEITKEVIHQSIYGVALALDLTLRKKQQELKEKGSPWEKAKAFDRSCPIGPFVCKSKIKDLNDLNFSLKINGHLKQQGNIKETIFNLTDIVKEITTYMTINAGDIILTGTPSGVGPLAKDDKLTLNFESFYELNSMLK